MMAMQTLGLLGGMSWESTTTYYQLINRRVRERLGHLHSAKCVIFSFDFEQIEQLQRAGDWDRMGELLCDGANRLKLAGVDAIVICTNTMHKLAPQIQRHVQLPLLHIASQTGHAITTAGYSRVGLLGTRYTMEQDFYKSELVNNFQLDVRIPAEKDRDIVHDIIYTELCNGIIKAESRALYLQIIDKMVADGAECIILGCTEIGLLITSTDVKVPVFDTTLIHALGVTDWAIDSSTQCTASSAVS
jgi:aspartate racemase